VQVDPVLVGAMRFAVERLLARHQRSVAPPGGFDLDALEGYWAAAVAILGDDITLAAVEELPIGAFGLTSVGVLTAHTLGQALDLLVRVHVPRVLPSMKLELRRVDQRSYDLELAFADATRGATAEEIGAAVIARHLPVVAVEPVVPRAVALRRPRPKDPARWARFFAAPVTFGHPSTKIRLPSAALALPLVTASPEVQELLTSERGAQSTVDAVRAFVRDHPERTWSLAAVAAALAIPPRTLQRRLSAEGSSLREVILAARLELARELLATSMMDIATIARSVGFKHPAAFTRAFRVAVGEAPAAYRRRKSGERQPQ
jgi:AraC-like DNA-binding protein